VTLHRNARTCPRSRKLLVDRVVLHEWPIRDAAEAAGVSQRTACKWLRRFREEGEAGLADRSSVPRRMPTRTVPERVDAILALRDLRFTAAEIAETLGMAHSTVSAVLKREGRGRLPRPDGDQPENRYERARPGELVHIDVKKLGRVAGVGHRITGERRKGGGHARGAGWEFVHVCIDDCTRLAYVEVLDDERKETVTTFLQRAVGWFADRDVIIERLMTDNGSGYRSTLHRRACEALGIRHLFTRPYRPRTNGKAERFIRTLLAGWAYQRLRHQRRTPRRPRRLPDPLQHPAPAPVAHRPDADAAPGRAKQDCGCLQLVLPPATT
jgi:transposase InsO family protein